MYRSHEACISSTAICLATVAWYLPLTLMKVCSILCLICFSADCFTKILPAPLSSSQVISLSILFVPMSSTSTSTEISSLTIFFTFDSGVGDFYG